MHTIRVHKVVDKDGEILVRGVPCKKGQHVEVIMLIEPPSDSSASYPTARQLLESELIGLWRDREDMGDSPAFARSLRSQAETRVGRSE